MWCQPKSALLAKLRPNAEQVLAVCERPVPVETDYCSEACRLNEVVPWKHLAHTSVESLLLGVN